MRSHGRWLHPGETEAFIEWLKGRLIDDAQRGPLQVMYGVDGRQELEEISLDQFCGYENSRPVRIGNAAYNQLQLDIYGAMMEFRLPREDKPGLAHLTCGMAGCSSSVGVAAEQLAAS